MSSFDLSGRMTIGNVLCRLGLMFACVCVWEIRGVAVEAAVKPKALEIAYGPFVDWVDRTTVTISWEVDEAMSGRVRWSMPGGKSVELSGKQQGKRHLVTVHDLSLHGEYTYRIVGIDGERMPKANNTNLTHRFIIDCLVWRTARRHRGKKANCRSRPIKSLSWPMPVPATAWCWAEWTGVSHWN